MFSPHHPMTAIITLLSQSASAALVALPDFHTLFIARRSRGPLLARWTIPRATFAASSTDLALRVLCWGYSRTLRTRWRR